MAARVGAQGKQLDYHFLCRDFLSHSIADSKMQYLTQQSIAAAATCRLIT